MKNNAIRNGIIRANNVFSLKVDLYVHHAYMLQQNTD